MFFKEHLVRNLLTLLKPNPVSHIVEILIESQKSDFHI